jgi:hypothetical protein
LVVNSDVFRRLFQAQRSLNVEIHGGAWRGRVFEISRLRVRVIAIQDLHRSNSHPAKYPTSLSQFFTLVKSMQEASKLMRSTMLKVVSNSQLLSILAGIDYLR